MEFRNSSGNRLGPRLAAITRCDLGQTFELNLDSSQYVSAPYPPKPLTKAQIKAEGLDRQRITWSEKPLVRIEIKTVDTGERKQLFGHTARHVVTTKEGIPLEGSHSQPAKTIRDGWYIDLDQQISCDPDYMRNPRGLAYVDFSVVSSASRDEIKTMDKPEFVKVGELETGFALEEVFTSDSAYKSPDGTTKHARSQSEMVVTELQEGPLDSALFEVPHGFKHVKEIERNPPLAPLNPMSELWERIKYTVTNWFTFD